MIEQKDRNSRGRLQLKNFEHDWGARTLIMGIVNVTPDSFSGDGLLNTDAAVAHALLQEKRGAAIVDLGAESTRPGFAPVDAEQEMTRLLPVVQKFRAASRCPISIDTTKAEVLQAAVEAGADMLNSIWGLTPALLTAVEALKIPVVLMHNKEKAQYDGDVVDEVLAKLLQQAEAALKAGVKAEQIILDPGIGFGKTAEHNLRVLQSLPRLIALGFPTLLGTSRKSFIGQLTGKTATERVYGTAATVALAVAAGIDIVRVHDVDAMVDVVKLADAVERGWRPDDWEC
ncbi:MAG: dihydropteroate synthase [Cyanobacteria bacterium REEB67]|nr:dihydropteroate synthase [Cyanobacteria bacterium REEB67]